MILGEGVGTVVWRFGVNEAGESRLLRDVRRCLKRLVV